MQLNPSKINWFLMFKLPAAYWCGVRLKTLTEVESSASVKFKWINQNPFRSMYFAVQMMAAELSTGALVMSKIKDSRKNVSMLVASNQAVFNKRVTGRVVFTCTDGALVSAVIAKMTAGEAQGITLRSIGTNEAGEIVSEMKFEWTLKLR